MQGKWFRILFRARDADRVLALPLASSYMATLPKREPTSAEYQALLNENDALRLENVQLRQTINHLELKEQAKEKRMGDLSRSDQCRTVSCFASSVELIWKTLMSSCGD
jgi:hypothetical protein